MNETVGLNAEVTSIIHELGIPAHVKGYFYLREAIIFGVNDPEIVIAVTKITYPDIAKMYNTTASRVERAIRHAIELSWCRCDIETRKKFFSNAVLYNNGKPTNAEFIATIVDRLKLKKKSFV